MAGSAPHIPKDDIEAAAQQPIQDEHAPVESDRSSLPNVAESALQLPKGDIEAAAQQPIQDEKPPADGDKRSHSDEHPEPTYEQRLYEFTNSIESLIVGDVCLYFRQLSYTNILHLMNELAKYEQATKNNKAAPKDVERLGDLLHRHSKSVKVAMVIVLSLRWLYVSYRCSGP